jgi:hypothetical protein
VQVDDGPNITYTMLCRRLIAIYIRSFGLARRRMQGCHGSKASQRAIQPVAFREVLFASGALAASRSLKRGECDGGPLRNGVLLVLISSTPRRSRTYELWRVAVVCIDGRMDS